MSPRRPDLLGPTSAERRGLDTGRGRDRREKDPRGGGGGGGVAGGGSFCAYFFPCSPQVPWTTFPRSLMGG